MRDDTRNWIASAEYDMETAQTLFDGGRYPYVVFMCHLALEKILKAHVMQLTHAEAPRTHSLPFLLRKAGLKASTDMAEFLGDITNESGPTRYPADPGEVPREYTREVAEECLDSTREVFKWLKDHPNLQE